MTPEELKRWERRGVLMAEIEHQKNESFDPEKDLKLLSMEKELAEIERIDKQNFDNEMKKIEEKYNGR